MCFLSGVPTLYTGKSDFVNCSECFIRTMWDRASVKMCGNLFVSDGKNTTVPRHFGFEVERSIFVVFARRPEVHTYNTSATVADDLTVESSVLAVVQTLVIPSASKSSYSSMKRATMSSA